MPELKEENFALLQSSLNIHPREIVSMESGMRFIEDIKQAYETGQGGNRPVTDFLQSDMVGDDAIQGLHNMGIRTLQDFLDTHEIYVINVNPDAHKKVEAGHGWRKNVNKSEGLCDIIYWIWHYGVDLNRNFREFWKIITRQHCNQEYQGQEAGSEPEVQALMNFYTRIFPALSESPKQGHAAPETIKGMHYTLHAYGRMLLVPWNYANEASPNQDQLRSLANGIIEKIRDVVYTFGGLNYRATGCETDNVYGLFGVPAIAQEVGEEFFVPFHEFAQLYKEEVKPGVLYSLARAHAPYIYGNGTIPTPLPTSTSTPSQTFTPYPSATGTPTPTVSPVPTPTLTSALHRLYLALIGR